MRIKLAIKTLFRSPLKTLVTFLLLLVVSFLLVYNIADYALVTREFAEAKSRYEGTLSVEYPAELRVRPYLPFFLLSDETNPANYDNFFVKEDYHLPDFPEETAREISDLPQITDTAPRYMTAGVSPTYFRTDKQGLQSLSVLNMFFPYANRCVLEATLVYVDANNYPDPINSGSSIGGMAQTQNNMLYIKDVTLLAGQEKAALRWQKEIGHWTRPGEHIPMPEGIYRIYVGTATEDFYKYGGGFVYTFGQDTREMSAHRNNHVLREDISALVPGQRYIFVCREGGRGSLIGSNPNLTLEDDTLYGWWPYIYPLEGQPENYLETEEFAPLRELIQITNDDAHTFDVVYSDDMKAIRRIAEERMLLTEGRWLTPEDTEQNAPVCVISDTMMQEFGLAIGDTFTLRLGDRLMEQYAPLGAVASTRGRYAENFTDEIDFKIVGAYKDLSLDKLRDSELFWAYSDNTVFVPLSFLPETVDTASHTFKANELSYVIRDADQIRPFFEQELPKLEEMGLDVYFSDGGWMSVETHLSRSQVLTVSKLIAFVATAALATLLTVYLFIVRKKKEFAIMRALGTPKGRARRALYIPLLLLGLLAILLGSVGAVLYAGQTAAETLSDFTEVGLTVDTSIPLGGIALGVMAELAFLVLVTLVSLVYIGRRPPLELLQSSGTRQKKRKTRAVPEISENVLPTAFAPLPRLEAPQRGGYSALRHVSTYVWRHSRRNLLKSVLAVALAALLFGAMGQFTLMKQSYEDLYRNVEVRPRFINGLPLSRAQKVAESGYVHDMYYEFRYTNGEANAVRAEFIMTNDLNRMTGSTVTYLEGYDGESIVDLKERVCVLSSALMDTLGLSLGDKVGLNELNYLGTLLSYGTYTDEEAQELYERKMVNCTVVGRIEDYREAVVYLPTGTRDYFLSFFNAVSLDLAEFVLNDYHQAMEFREYAKEIVNITGIMTTPMFLMDTGEADSVYMIYRLIETLYPIAMTVALLIGGLLPGLIILQSAREASILRVLGTTKKRTRAMLLLEQLVLCLPGLILALLVLIFLNGTALLAIAASLALYCVLHFAVCTVGSSAAAVNVTKRKVLELLQTKE